MTTLKTPLWQALLIAGGCVFTHAAAAQQAEPVWAEEFDGERLNRSFWNFETGGHGFGNGELQYYTASSENVYLDDGQLVIEARNEEHNGNLFTSGRINTHGRVGFRYGVLEARIKLPDLGNGLWPAFWMLGNNYGIDGWPKSGEWDILEAGSREAIDNGTVNQTVSGAMHWWHESGDWSDWLQADAASSIDVAGGLNTYRVYRMEWTPSEVSMSVDGTEYFSMDITDPNMSEFRENPAHIILNMAVGGFNFVQITDPNNITAPFPAKMYVDYVRLYENQYTELDIAEEHLFSGNYGIMTETTPVLNELNWGDNTNLYIWNNMTTVATAPSEGSAALAYEVAPGDWWGMGLLHKDQNLRNYQHGYLHFDMKTESPTPITVGMGSTAGGDGSVELSAGAEQYGLERDGEWHHVAIPLSQFSGVDFETVQALFTLSGPAPAALMTVAVDNIYLTESVALEAPEYGNFGIYTETPAHRDAGNFGFGVSGDLFIWENTLTLSPGDVKEGNASLNLASNDLGWYGMGLTARQGFNLTAFDNASAMLHFSLKTTSQSAFQIGMKSGNRDDIGQLWIDFEAGNDPYGFVRDGTWQDIAIPMSDVAKDVDLADVRQLFQLLGTGEIDNIAIDDIYLSGGQQAEAPGTDGEEVNRAPRAAVKTSAMRGSAPLNVTLDASDSVDVNGDTLTYLWDFGDGTLGSGATVNHEFTEEGRYAVSVTVSDGELSDTTTNYVLVDNGHASVRSEKRGLGYGYHSEEDFAKISQGISWWYNWSHKPDVMIEDVYQNYGVEFAPMAWNGGFDDQAMREYLLDHPEVQYLLAFNEPNFLDQANMTPSQAVAEWPRLEAIADEFDLEIVSVAMNYCGNCNSEGGTTYYDPIDYLDDFFDLCPDCQVDAISIHAYMQDAGGVEWYVDRFKKYNKPIWMTEFSHWEDFTTQEDQKRFLVQVVDAFENDPDLERYAWFTGRRDGHPFNGLFDNRQSGVLTELGSIYVNMPVHNASNVHTLPSRVQAEEYAAMSDIIYPNVEDDKRDVRVELTEDHSGFLNLSDMDPGSWVEYRVSGDGGLYEVTLRVASAVGGTLTLSSDGNELAQVSVPATGGLQSWQTVTTTVDLDAGNQPLRLMFSDAINVNWLTFEEGSDNGGGDEEPEPTGDLAEGQPAVSSSQEAGWLSAAQAVDGDGGTRWASAWTESEWIYVDLGTSQTLSQVVLDWEGAYGKGYEIQVSDDASTWTTVYTETAGVGGVDDIAVNATGRYVRMLGTERGTGYGYSLWRFEVY
ncbi:glycosyl hydrolase [Marinimicrobium sp. ARAG 43.8]|uniref:glycosyl hydrolase n=1 Tax=Marinimicrobium sp. ARAG 43.8 TaxID=3418719 RepID=UPI003CF7D421